MDEITELETVVVHTNEVLPVLLNPAVQEVSQPVEMPDGNVLVYIGRKPIAEYIRPKVEKLAE